MTQMSNGAMRNLAVEVAIELRKLRNETWTADDGDGRGEYTLTGPGRARLALDFHVYGNDSKLTVQGLYPDGCGGKMFYAGVNPERGASVIAKAASNRVLAAGYADELLNQLARKAEAGERQAVRDSWLDEAARLFGIDRKDGHKDKLYLSDFTTLRSSVKASGPYTGEDKMKVSIELNGLDPETALAVLKALAGTRQAHAVCCRKFGPGHDRRLSLLGCLRSSRRADPPTAAEAEALYDLWRTTPSSASWETWLGDTDVHPMWR